MLMNIKNIITVFVCACALTFSGAVCRANDIYATVQVPSDKIIAVTKLLEDIASKINVTYTLYNSLEPKIVLAGESNRVQKVKTLIEQADSAQTVQELVYVNCTMETLNEGDIKDLGILPAAGISVNSAVADVKGSFLDMGDVVSSWQAKISTLGDLATIKLQETLNKGNIIASGDMILPNGINGILQAKESLPLEVKGVNNISSYTYKDLLSEIRITPTILEYNKEKPECSLIKLDINMSFSAEDNISVATTLPYISTRESHTMRVVRANDQIYIVGGIVRDKLIKADTGIPGLRDIPVLKYLFSNVYERKVREYGILRLNVHLVKPDSVTTGKIVNNIQQNSGRVVTGNSADATAIDDDSENLLQAARLANKAKVTAQASN